MATAQEIKQMERELDALKKRVYGRARTVYEYKMHVLQYKPQKSLFVDGIP